jgi:hypothetical protein
LGPSLKGKRGRSVRRDRDRLTGDSPIQRLYHHWIVYELRREVQLNIDCFIGQDCHGFKGSARSANRCGSTVWVGDGRGGNRLSRGGEDIGLSAEFSCGEANNANGRKAGEGEEFFCYHKKVAETVGALEIVVSSG